MFTINESVTNKLEIKKSVFITKLYKVKDINDVMEYINIAKKEYKDATHYTYAYIIDDQKKSSDDNEPSGTAGIPIMEVLLKNDLNYILCIVIRYFGGIRLGSGGLIRAYSKSVRESINKNNLNTLIDGFKIKIIVGYDKQNNIDYLLKNYMFKKEYNDSITYIINCDKSILKKLQNNNINFEILGKIKIGLD